MTVTDGDKRRHPRHGRQKPVYATVITEDGGAEMQTRDRSPAPVAWNWSSPASATAGS